LENRFLGHKQAVYDLQLDGFGGWYSAGSEGWIVHWQGGSEINGKLIAQAGEPIYSIYVIGRYSDYILAGGQSGTVYAFRRIGPTVPRKINGKLYELELHNSNPSDPQMNETVLNSNQSNDSLSYSENWELQDLKFEKMWEYRIHEKGVFDFLALPEVQNSVDKPTEKMIISCAADGIVALWDLENPMNHHVKSNSIKGSLRCIDATSSLETQIRVGGHAGKVYEFKIEGSSRESFKFQEIRELCIGSNTLFQMVHHQSKFAFGGRDAKIWLTDEQLNIHRKMDAHWFSIHALAFSPDGNYLASGSMDKSIRIWDTESGELLVHQELAHRSSVNQLIWLDGETLISCSDDAQIISWKIIH